MGHYMTTLNPDAAAAIRPPVVLPPIGTPVVYHTRPGFGRRGRSEFPAVVIGHNGDSGGVELTVTCEAGDQIDESHVLPWSPTNGHHAFRVLDSSSDGGLRAEFDLFQAEVRERLDELKMMICGNFEPVETSVYALLQEFEAKLDEPAPKAAKAPKRK